MIVEKAKKGAALLNNIEALEKALKDFKEFVYEKNAMAKLKGGGGIELSMQVVNEDSQKQSYEHTLPWYGVQLDSIVFTVIETEMQRNINNLKRQLDEL